VIVGTWNLENLFRPESSGGTDDAQVYEQKQGAVARSAWDLGGRFLIRNMPAFHRGEWPPDPKREPGWVSRRRGLVVPSFHFVRGRSGSYRVAASASNSTGGRSCRLSWRRSVLNQLTYSTIASSSWLRVRQTRSRISSVLKVSTKLSAIALS
jgi:hypothetical protein